MRHCRTAQANIQPASEGADNEHAKQVQRKRNFAQKRHRSAFESVMELGGKCHSSNNQNSWEYGPEDLADSNSHFASLPSVPAYKWGIAVRIFFVLNGFVLSLSYFRKKQERV